jgi:4-carboxymuconolactone decarboxylase
MRIRLAATWLCFLSVLALPAEPIRAQRAEQAGSAQAAPPNFELAGNRFAPLTWAEMTEAQRTMARHVLDGPRTTMAGPFNVMLRAPLMGDYAQELGAEVRFNSSLPPPLREMAILLVTRHWTSHFEWNAHKRAALAEGLDPDIVAAIAAGTRPGSLQSGEDALYRFCTELLETKRVGDETFAAAKAAFGERGIAEIIHTLGYYSLVAMLLNVDEHPLPAGVEPELRPLAR